MSDIEQIVNDLTNARWDAMEEITRLRSELTDYKNAAASEADRVNELTSENRKLCEENRKLLEAVEILRAKIWQATGEMIAAICGADKDACQKKDEQLHGKMKHYSDCAVHNEPALPAGG